MNKVCPICQRFEQPTNKEFLILVCEATRPGQALRVDFVGPLLVGKRGYIYIVCVIDHLTRWAHARPVVDSTAKTVIKMLDEWIREWGTPQWVMTNGASNFHSEKVRHWATRKNIELLRAPAHHNRANGIVEKFQRSLIDMVRFSVYDLGGWYDHIEKATKMLQNIVHKGTGFNPQQLKKGAREDWKVAAEGHQKARQKANEKQRIHTWHHYIGEWVLLRDYERMNRMDGKFQLFWRGPYVILKQMSRTRFLLGPMEEIQQRGRKPYLVVYAVQIKHFYR